MKSPNSGNRKHRVKGVSVQIREMNSGLDFKNSENSLVAMMGTSTHMPALSEAGHHPTKQPR